MPSRRRRPAPRRSPLSPDDLLLFSAVAKANGVRGAAQALGVPRSTVSRRLEQLERAVGGRLVTRTTRRFTLTALGSSLAARAAQLEGFVRETEQLVGRAFDEPQGTLRVATSPLLGEEYLPEAIAELLARAPRLEVELELSAEFVDLRSGEVDVAVRTGPLPDTGELFATRLGTSVTGHYASPAYLAARGTPSHPDALREHDCLCVGLAPSGSWWFQTPKGELRVPVRGRLRSDSFRLARSAAAAGAGILRTARGFAAPLVEEGQLVPVLERFWPRVTIYAVHAAGQPAPPKIRAFVDLLRSHLRGRLE